ncbi:MAG: hypothetical protein ER33_10120 [Cyanobium sp. CACIAM 14]|nr:MAG: hypothetical protein ER33_10120 [Cyanobium sp. CACIAM 14]
MDVMAAAVSAFQEWLLHRVPEGSAATLPENLRRAFEADDPRLAPVFVAHDWQAHLDAELSRRLREAAEAERQRQELLFRRRLGLDAEADGNLALALDRAVEGALKDCHCVLELIAEPMPDGQQADGERWFRLEIGSGEAHRLVSASGRGAGEQTLEWIPVASRCQAEAISEAIQAVLSARGFQPGDDQGRFQLEGPQLGALVATLKRQGRPEPAQAP